MRILFLISQLPYPVDTGAKIRGFNLIKSLSDRHDITLVAFGDKTDEEIKKYCKNVVLTPKKHGNPYIQAIANIFSQYPYSVDKYYSRQMEEKIRVLLRDSNYDLIHCDSLQMSRNILRFTSIPKVLTEHNIESQILKRAAQEEENVLKKFYLYYQYLRLKCYEIYTCKQFDHVITVSEEDKKFLTKFITEKKISVVPNGVDTNYFNAQYTIRNTQYEDSIVFTGSMDWLPNIDAVKYFCKDILPLIWKVKKNLKFYVVGRNAPKDILELGKKDGRIVITGSVEDVRPYIEKAKAFVVPLRIGGGTRLKILEAMSMNKAIVSTSIGCEGLKVTDRENILIANKSCDFASRVLDLLDNEKLCNELSTNGRNLVEKIYDWQMISTELNKVWTNAASKGSLPILLYHDICNDEFDINKVESARKPYVIKISEFEKQVAWMAKNGYRGVSCGFWVEDKGGNEYKKSSVIVFDDGLISNYKKALPVLKKYNMKATFFITAANVGKDGFMGWDNIKELLNSGMEIGSHSLTHAIPTSLTEKELEKELMESKSLLESNLKTKIDYFSSPTGFYNDLLPDLAKKAGYKAVLISKASLNKIGDGHVLYKTSVKRGYSIEKFISIIKGDKIVLYELRSKQETRDRLKKILGHKLYNLARKIALGVAK
jgi:sugar transferase (PEP-CTERM/EpsH1 system associated)